MIEKILVPDIGENVVSGKVVAVHVQAGDILEVDQTIVELETDKAVVEIPSPFKGQVGEPIATVDIQAGHPAAAGQTPGELRAAEKSRPEAAQPRKQTEPAAVQPGTPAGKDAEQPLIPETPARATQPAAIPAPAGRPVPASPAIRRLARELGIDIGTIQGSGPGGRITEADIKAHVRRQQTGAKAAGALSLPVGEQPHMPDFSRWGTVEAVELDTVRRLTAESTALSWRTIPHVTQFDKADITALLDFIQQQADTVAKAGGRLTLTPVLTKVCALALKKFPRFNTSLDMVRQRLIFKHEVHIGIAVDTPRGLLMPVIRQADTRSITELAVAIVDLADRARNKKVTSAELEGGTFSISNQGGIGGVGFTPIILWPQVAILGISRSSVEPVFVNGQFEPRTMLPLSLSYDHRVIDGADAARFLRWICDCLAQPMTLLL
jgi:pyruvate dehydrogenase E2 component (dihydrolipoamide acetyltransferase)